MVSHRPTNHLLMVALAAWLLVAGSLFPRGYMPVGEGERITIALCSAGGTRTVELDLGRDGAPSQHTGSANCDGIAAAAAVLPPAAALPGGLHYSRPLPAPFPAGFVAPFRAAFDPNAPPHAPPAAQSRPLPSNA